MLTFLKTLEYLIIIDQSPMLVIDDHLIAKIRLIGYQKVEGIAGVILEAMKTQGGYIPVHDKSDPDVIYSLFRCSKKAFKQAIGALYKQHLITLEDGGIRLVNEK